MHTSLWEIVQSTFYVITPNSAIGVRSVAPGLENRGKCQSLIACQTVAIFTKAG